MTNKNSELPAALETLRVLPTAAAASFTGYEVQHWRALHRAGKTPPAIKLSERKYGWRVSDLIAWQETKRTVPAAA
jgi:predicted DNA-binding transcriptional regulator AlpA